MSDPDGPLCLTPMGLWYDSIGNYTQTVRRAMTEMYGPNNLNQYTNRVRITNGGATNEFRYDANGNLLYDGTLNYAWDEENRLIMVSNETWHTEFVYDGLWRRVETREYTNGSLAFVKRHVYDGWLPVVELNETNGLVSAMTWGLDLSLTLEGAGGIGGLLADLRPLTSDILFFYYDGNGNVVDVLDDADSLVAHYEYDPFGNRLLADGPHADQPFQWSTKQHHEPSGLVYYGYRFYHPELGRWTQRDPIEEQGGLNLYGFVDNNPVLKFDPLGQKACDASDIEQCKALCKAQFKEYLGCKKYLVCVYPVWPPPSYNKVYHVKCSCSKKLCFFTHADPSLIKKGWYDCHYACAGDRSKTIMAPTKEGCPKTIAD